jgi:hypothetical protein
MLTIVTKTEKITYDLLTLEYKDFTLFSDEISTYLKLNTSIKITIKDIGIFSFITNPIEKAFKKV